MQDQKAEQAKVRKPASPWRHVSCTLCLHLEKSPETSSIGRVPHETVRDYRKRSQETQGREASGERAGARGLTRAGNSNRAASVVPPQALY